MADMHIQLAVLGGGPGGYPAAFAAADHGMQAVLIDEGSKPGGVCLNRGCIPSKALLHVAKLLHEAEEAAQCGVVFQKPVIDLDKLRSFKNGVVGSLSGGIESLCKARGVELIRARGTFVNSRELLLKYPDGTSKTLSFDH
ncbi:MAG: FAD-dependent oxidoreductase, partial [Planctomyces sp.]